MACSFPMGFLERRTSGLASDGLNRSYMAINGAGVYRYTVSTRATQLISTGGNHPNTGEPLAFAVVGGQSNLLMLDRLDNLWIGDDASDGIFNFVGRIWYISARQLANIP